jgi:hypothetical protein
MPRITLLMSIQSMVKLSNRQWLEAVSTVAYSFNSSILVTGWISSQPCPVSSIGFASKVVSSARDA